MDVGTDVQYDVQKARLAAGYTQDEWGQYPNWGIDYQEFIRIPLIDWCHENCKGKFAPYYGSHAFTFQNTTDAAMFKLVWG